MMGWLSCLALKPVAVAEFFEIVMAEFVKAAVQVEIDEHPSDITNAIPVSVDLADQSLYAVRPVVLWRIRRCRYGDDFHRGRQARIDRVIFAGKPCSKPRGASITGMRV